MNDNELNDLLEKLHLQIEHTQTLDADQQEQLRHIEGDIRKLLDRSPTKTTESQPAILTQLEGAITTYELTHPGLAMTFTKLMEILSNAGI